MGEQDWWTEWGVRRTWGPNAGSVAEFRRDRRTAEKCARDWPGELVRRLVQAGAWTETNQPQPAASDAAVAAGTEE